MEPKPIVHGPSTGLGIACRDIMGGVSGERPRADFEEGRIAYLLLFLLGILIAYLVLSLLAGRPLFVTDRGHDDDLDAKSSPGSAGRPKTCPVCGSLLAKGERVKSVVFAGGVRSGAITEKMSNIFGCPHCYPANAKNPRICPVCGKVLPGDGYLVARMFENPAKPRKHVHVLGCTVCREGRK